MGDMAIELTDVKIAGMVPVSQELLDDVPRFDWDGIYRDIRWGLMGENPWPRKGFNPHKHTFPEPYAEEVCECCGQPLEEDCC